jgi:hypothetical protein
LTSEAQTGFTVSPFEVRLSPPGTAPYRWQILQPEAKRLFHKPLSRCTVGDCQDLLRFLGNGFQACPKNSDFSPAELALNTIEEDIKAVNRDQMTMPVDYGASAEEAWYVDSIRQLEQDIFVSQTRIEELERKIVEADEQIVNQGTQIFQSDLMVGRIAQVLQEYQQSNQTYGSV